MLDRRRFAALSSAWALAPTLARAQAPAYPSRFVRLIVPFPPGGGTDAIARVVSAKLSALWGQQMVVENKGGGATSIGTDAVAKSDPDGYTVLLQSVPLAVNKFLFATLPFDPVADLAPVTLISTTRTSWGYRCRRRRIRCRNSSPMPRPIPARPIMRRPDTAPRCICPASCSTR
jgi:tripartite-type tricarboxylate transporter receptor subunit TctC